MSLDVSCRLLEAFCQAVQRITSSVSSWLWSCASCLIEGGRIWLVFANCSSGMHPLLTLIKVVDQRTTLVNGLWASRTISNRRFQRNTSWEANIFWGSWSSMVLYCCLQSMMVFYHVWNISWNLIHLKTSINSITPDFVHSTFDNFEWLYMFLDVARNKVEFLFIGRSSTCLAGLLRTACRCCLNQVVPTKQTDMS